MQFKGFFTNVYFTARDLKEVSDYLFQFNLLNTISTLNGFPLRDQKIGKKFRIDLLKEVFKTIQWEQNNIKNGYYTIELKNYNSLGKKTKDFLKILLDYSNVIKLRKNSKTTLNDSSLPKYYNRHFHFQSDGYLSEKSAELYEAQVNILFTGLADIMRKSFLPFVVHHLRNKENLQFLEMASGTGMGSFLLNKIFPDAYYTLNDLSPFYLKKAQEKLGTKNKVFIQGEAQRLQGVEDETFDLSFHIFLFHELPEIEREKVLKEQMRVTKKDGFIIICDSLQISDRPEWKEILEDFPRKYHEPFYNNYIKSDLRSLMSGLGLQVVHEEKVLLAKCLIAKKAPTISKES